MRAAVGFAWRGAAIFAFGATAALAVALGHPDSAPAALTASHQQSPPASAVVCAGPGAGHGHCARARSGRAGPAPAGTVHPGLLHPGMAHPGASPGIAAHPGIVVRRGHPRQHATGHA